MQDFKVNWPASSVCDKCLQVLVITTFKLVISSASLTETQLSLLQLYLCSRYSLLGSWVERKDAYSLVRGAYATQNSLSSCWSSPNKCFHILLPSQLILWLILSIMYLSFTQTYIKITSSLLYSITSRSTATAVGRHWRCRPSTCSYAMHWH